MTRPIVIGHRGAHSIVPENTLESFKHAISLGIDMVELDVQESEDGHLVVIHDSDVSRLSSGEGVVSELNLLEIKALDLGNGYSIPTLDEVLDLCNRRCKVNIDIKEINIEERLLQLVNSRAMLEDVIFSSFLHGTLIAIKEVEPLAETAVLYEHPIEDPTSYAVDIGASAINPRYSLLEKSIVEDAHDAGLKVYPWTVNDEGKIEELLGIGIDGIITDIPEACIRLIENIFG